MQSRLSDSVQAYSVCKDRDLVAEMVFLLGRMGNNKQALTLIIERLGDVQMVCAWALGHKQLSNMVHI